MSLDPSENFESQRVSVPKPADLPCWQALGADSRFPQPSDVRDACYCTESMLKMMCLQETAGPADVESADSVITKEALERVAGQESKFPCNVELNRKIYLWFVDWIVSFDCVC